MSFDVLLDWREVTKAFQRITQWKNSHDIWQFSLASPKCEALINTTVSSPRD